MCINQLILIVNGRVPNIKTFGTPSTDKNKPLNKKTGQRSRGLTIRDAPRKQWSAACTVSS